MREQVIERAFEDIYAFTKEQIEKLRCISIETQKMYDTGYFAAEGIQNIDGNAVDVAYNLLSELYNTGGDEKQTIWNEFHKYMYGEAYADINEFIDWLNTI